MAKLKRQMLTDVEMRIIKSAREGDIKAFCDALLEHPEDGRLLRTLALEDQAVEWEAVMKRITEVSKEKSGDGRTKNQNRHP
jgi:hypothetical protein